LKYNEFTAIIEFLGSNMTDQDAERIMDMAKEYLSPEEIISLGECSCFYNGKLYTYTSEYQGECGLY